MSGDSPKGGSFFYEKNPLEVRASGFYDSENLFILKIDL